MDGEILRDDQWERLREFVPGGRRGKRGDVLSASTQANIVVRSWPLKF